METCLTNLEKMFESGVTDIHFQTDHRATFTSKMLILKKQLQGMKELLLMNPIFNTIDAIKSGSIEDLNEIVRTNGQNPISNIDSIDFHVHYNSGVATRRINAKTTENRDRTRIK